MEAPDRKCCETWEHSKLSGTDNEMYGSVTWECDGKWRIGCDLPPVKFCPWCAAPKNSMK